MVDILGPSGQPLQPNPFSKSQNITSSLDVNTSQAEKAIDELKSRYDELSRSFGRNWEKTVDDKTRAEERFFSTLGNLVKSNESVLKTQQAQYFKLLDARTQAELDNYKKTWAYANTSVDGRAEYERRKWTDNENEKLKIATETEKKISAERLKSKFGATAIQDLGQRIGGVGGSAISSVGGVLGEALTHPIEFLIGAAITAGLETAITNAKFTKVSANLANAGLGIGTGAGAGLGLQSRVFGGTFGNFKGALSADEQAAILSQMATSRTLIGQTTSTRGADKFAQNIGMFANILPDAAEETKLFTDATKTLGMSQEQITKSYYTSSANAKNLNITQLDALHTQIEMAKALRNITNDGAVAVNVLSSVTDYLNSIGASEAEKQRIGVSVAQAGANLSLPQIAGMFSLTHKGKMPTEQELFGVNGVGGMMGKGGTGTFGLLGTFLSQIGTQFKDPTQRMFAADALRQQFIPGLRMQDTPKFFELANDLMKTGNQTKFNTQIRELEKNTPASIATQGFQVLKGIVGPIDEIQKALTNFWIDADKFWNRHFGDNVRPSTYLHDKPQMGVGKNATAGRKF